MMRMNWLLTLAVATLLGTVVGEADAGCGRRGGRRSCGGSVAVASSCSSSCGTVAVASNCSSCGGCGTAAVGTAYVGGYGNRGSVVIGTRRAYYGNRAAARPVARAGVVRARR